MQDAQKELELLVRSRHAMIAIETSEEARALELCGRSGLAVLFLAMFDMRTSVIRPAKNDPGLIVVLLTYSPGKRNSPGVESRPPSRAGPGLYILKPF